MEAVQGVKGRSVAAQQSNEAQKESSGIPPELDSYLADIFGPKKARLDDELAEYLAEGTEPFTCDVVAYWRKKRLLCPKLATWREIIWPQRRPARQVSGPIVPLKIWWDWPDIPFLHKRCK